MLAEDCRGLTEIAVNVLIGAWPESTITRLFACPDYPPSTNHTHVRLPLLIAYALRRTKLHPAITFTALVLLHRLCFRAIAVLLLKTAMSRNLWSPPEGTTSTRHSYLGVLISNF